MPYKEHVIPLVDEMDASASAIQSVNTIVNTDGHLRAYNTDYLAVTQVLASHQVPTDDDFAILGSGGMAKAVVAACGTAGSATGTSSPATRTPGTPWPSSTASSPPPRSVTSAPA